MLLLNGAQGSLSVKYAYYYLGYWATGVFCCHKIAGADQ